MHHANHKLLNGYNFIISHNCFTFDMYDVCYIYICILCVPFIPVDRVTANFNFTYSIIWIVETFYLLLAKNNMWFLLYV